MIYLKFGGSGCQEITSKGVYTMERRSLQFLHQWCLSRNQTVGESARSLAGDLIHTGMIDKITRRDSYIFVRIYIYNYDLRLRQGESFLVVTHKSILRALICTALGLGPER